MIHMKSEIESFILNDSKNVNNKESQALEKRTEDILSIFPLNTDDELLAIECKLKDEDDLSYTQKLVSNISNNILFFRYFITYTPI